MARFWQNAMYVRTEAVHTYIAKRPNSPMYSPVQAISPFTNRRKSGCKSEPFRNTCKNFLNCIAAEGFLYLCSADSKRLAACAFRHKLSAFLCRLCCPIGTPCCQERRAGRNRPTQLPSAAQRYNTLDFPTENRVPRNPGAVSLDSSGAKGRRSGPGPRRKKPPPSGREGGGKRVWCGGYSPTGPLALLSKPILVPA